MISGSSMRQTRLTVPSASVASPHGSSLECRFEVSPGVPLVEGEDGGEVVSRRLGEAQAIFLGSGLGALVRPDLAGSVVGDAHPAEEAAAGVLRAVRPLVVLLERPERRLAIRGEDSLERPCLQRFGCVCVPVAAARGFGKVDLDDVERRTLEKGLAHLGVDDVVWRRDDVAERRHGVERVVKCFEGADFSHFGAAGYYANRRSYVVSSVSSSVSPGLVFSSLISAFRPSI